MVKLPIECCGCELCIDICPKNAIHMERNQEGFYYPVVNPDDCINCKLCKKKCPVINNNILGNIDNIAFYGGYIKDEKELLQSASGGFASSMSKVILNKGGVVYGTKYTPDCKQVLFDKANCVNDILKFKGSKYSQARKIDTYKSVEEDLKNNKIVFFVGLPCEVYALKLFLYPRDYDNLLTCDLICHGVTSEKVLEEYIDEVEKKHGKKIRYFTTRYKNGKATPPYIRCIFDDQTEFKKELYTTEYGIAFQVLKRPSCNNCNFKGQNRNSDYTIGDFHGVSNKLEVYNKNGVSTIIVHTMKGERFLKEIKKEDFLMENINEQAALNNRAYSISIPKMCNRKIFVNNFVKNGLMSAANMKITKYAESLRRFKKKMYAYRYIIKNVIRHKNGFLKGK